MHSIMGLIVSSLSPHDLHLLFYCIIYSSFDMISPFIVMFFAAIRRAYGEHLTDFTLENRLTCLHSKFQKREGKLWTYKYANNTKAQIDYVFMNKKWNNRALNCEAYSSFDGVSSNHRIVTAKIRLSLRRNTAQTITTVHYDWSLLNNRNVRDKFSFKFDAQQEQAESHTPNDEYENFVNAHIETTAECIPTKQRAKPRFPWEILAVRKKAGRRENCLQMQFGRTKPIPMPWNLRHKMN